MLIVLQYEHKNGKDQMVYYMYDYLEEKELYAKRGHIGVYPIIEFFELVFPENVCEEPGSVFQKKAISEMNDLIVSLKCNHVNICEKITSVVITLMQLLTVCNKPEEIKSEK